VLLQPISPASSSEETAGTWTVQVYSQRKAHLCIQEEPQLWNSQKIQGKMREKEKKEKRRGKPLKKMRGKPLKKRRGKPLKKRKGKPLKKKRGKPF